MTTALYALIISGAPKKVASFHSTHATNIHMNGMLGNHPLLSVIPTTTTTSSTTLIDATMMIPPMLSPLSSTKLFAAKKSSSSSSSPGDELFPPKGSSYVPYGMTEKEYAAIIAKERKELGKKKFGMWGPRFKPTDTPPDGDWMVQPGLWSMGFQSNTNRGNLNGGTSTNKSSSTVQVWLDFCRRHLAAFVTVYSLLQLFQIAMVQLWSTTTTTMALLTRGGGGGGGGLRVAWTSILRALLVFVVPPSPVAAGKKSLLLLLKNWTTNKWWLAVTATKLASALVLACPMEMFGLEELNRKRLWSRRRSMLTILGLGLLSLMAWDGILLVVGSIALSTMS